MQYLWLVLLGLGAGAFGTLIGAGGGFILMPILLLAYPDKSPATLTAISLGMVFFNATSGSYSYARMKRVDFKSGFFFLLTGVPGAIAGASLVNFIPREPFNLVFGVLLLGGGLFILLQTFRELPHKQNTKATFKRSLVDIDGVRHEYGFSLAGGMVLSFAVGLVSSMLGIGGGIIHVPAMVNMLNFPVHIATATSHFILAVMALTGTIVHIIDGTLGWGDAPGLLALGGGAVVGAKVGAYLSQRIHGRWIMRGLAIALAIVGVRVLLAAILSLTRS